MNRTLALFAVVAAAALTIGWLTLSRGAGTERPDARQLVHDGAWLVDVRSPAEFAGGHLPGAINIPVAELERRLAELEPVDRPVVLYCRSGARSARAADALRNAGWLEVHDLGPMSAW